MEIPINLSYDGVLLELQKDKSHGYNQVILLNNGLIGRRERSVYPNWWKGNYTLNLQNGERISFHVSEIAGVYCESFEELKKKMEEAQTEREKEESKKKSEQARAERMSGTELRGKYLYNSHNSQ